MTFVPHYYVEDHEDGTLRSSNDGSRVDKQPLVANTVLGHRGKAGSGVGPDETFVADTLTSGSHPGSNMPGRRREDDSNLIHSFNSSGGSRGLHDYEDETPPIKVGSAVGIPSPPAISSSAGVRRLTPVECERLQGLPDGWTQVPDDAPDSRRYAGIGDAVTANVAYWIGRRLLEKETT